MELLTSPSLLATPYITGLLLGATAMLVAINLGQAWIRRESLNLWLALYSIAMTAAIIGWWSFLGIAVLAQSVLFWRFVPIANRWSRWSRGFLAASASLVVIALLTAVFLSPQPLSVRIFKLSFLCSTALCALHLWQLCRAEISNASLLLLAKVFSVFAYGGIWGLGITAAPPLTHWLAQATVIIECMVITYALVMNSVEHWQQRIRQHYERSLKLKLKQQYNSTLKGMDHELRSPLSGVVGIAELLLDTPLNKNQRDQVSTMRRASEALLKWLNRLNDWRALQIGLLHFDALPFDFSELLQTLYEDCREKAEDRKIQLHYTPHPNTPSLIKGDPARLKQIISGTLELALFYSEQGEITLELKPGAQRNHWQLLITDSQSGLHPNDLEIALADEREQHAEHYSSVQRNWLIAKALAGYIGGQLEATLDAGQARFCCDLVLTRYALLQHHENEVDQLLQRKRLLVVSDSSSGRQLVAKRAEGWGMIATSVPAGKDALSMINTMNPLGAGFDAIIFDDDLPDMTGLVLATHIAQHPSLKAVPVMIMLSDDPNLPQMDSARNVLIRRVLSKPISAQSLKITLAEELTLQQARDQSPLAESPLTDP